MKHVILIAVFLCTAWLGQQVYAQQGFGTNAPDRSAAVDIVSTKRGLLIPRISLTGTNDATTVNNPHNSLLVYNTNTSASGPDQVTPGFYYYEVTGGGNHGAGKWVKFVSSETEKTTSVSSANDRLTVGAPVTTGNNTNYELTVDETKIELNNLSTTGGKLDENKISGGTAGQVLVTKETTPGSGVFEATWVNPQDFVNDAILGVNGITTTVNGGVVEIGLGGTLNAGTTDIATNGTTSQLAITGLQTVTSYDKVMVLDANGVLQAADLSSLVQADNGLKVGASGINEGKVILGGTLNEATEIVTDVTNTLAIAGLGAANAANKIVVANDGTGVLQTVERVLNYPVTATGSFAIGSQSGYNQYAQEVNVYATLPSSGNIVVTLPSPAATGQVINVKITNTDETHTGEVQISDGAPNPLTYGALPFQGWILKSNGTNWMIVGRN